MTYYHYEGYFHVISIVIARGKLIWVNFNYCFVIYMRMIYHHCVAYLDVTSFVTGRLINKLNK